MLAKPPSTFWQEAACSRAEPSPGLLANTQEPNWVTDASAPTFASTSVISAGTLPLRRSDSAEAQALVKKLQDYITQHFYNCTKEILSGLGKMYAGGGDFTKNIDSYGGEGTAEFVHQAIEVYCKAE